MSRITFRALAVMIFAAAPPVLMAQTSTPSLVGSWEFTVTTPSATSAVATLPFEGLATFTSDGTVVETDIQALLTPATPGHGIWQQGPIPPPVGYKYVRFTTLIPNVNGSLRSKRIVTMLITLNSAGDQFTGTWEYEVVDSKGKVLSTGSANVTGELMPHPLLP